VTPLDATWLRRRPLPRPGDGGKTERGTALVVGGAVELIGASLLAGEAALRAGAGKLQVLADTEAVAPLSVALPEARLIRRPGRDRDGDAGTVEILKGHIERCDALLIGPGMFDDEAGFVRQLLDLDGDRPLVLDAGALGALKLGAPVSSGRIRVLTPHAGEMGRLLDRDASAIERDALHAAREAVTAFGAVVVLKGAATHVVSPEGEAVLYAGGGPGLGVSGSGDVLAGLIAGLLARGAEPFTAAAWGVYLHGEAGQRLAARLGPLGFLAREIAAEAPAIMGAFI
jgi:ADP-dependent NAD(P)H-hydrate dehydratase